MLRDEFFLNITNENLTLRVIVTAFQRCLRCAPAGHFFKPKKKAIKNDSPTTKPLSEERS